ncbi:hypothetical protein K458DRAFT_294513 [Lentithecium fluviatile CBS 122367]|uniref:SNF2 N-terminal domain-containing protein n=1 Tax=Lentithecium fluviatile CBS 122367 TaxID=1168545 RepID=A0A6G1JD03_9PLEO|nr:hypothetical protein K458DRAFT_294513 [Lentithecium fluviatile CBS 122367]
MTEEEDEEEEFVPTIAAVKKSTTNKKAGKGIDTTLPPLYNIDHIFADMAIKSIDLGLLKALSELGNRCLNVATMCSGTEAPIIALELLSQALEQRGIVGIRVNHRFSAEINPSKQAYIERNFQPKLLFRDVREFIPPDSKTATTAYGAEEPIPGGIDFLVAGFVCKDLSRLNNHQKGLDDEGESGDTWNAIYSYTKRFRPRIVLIENVKHTREFWDGFKAKWAAIGYEYTWIFCDTKDYYIPQTRQRMYMIAIDQSQYAKGVEKALGGWEDLMKKLQRRCSSPFDAFLAVDTPDHNRCASLASDPSWALCKLRYDLCRADLRLGIGRTVTRWSEDGTVRPPDWANHVWYHSQSQRVFDCIDIANLIGAQQGHDSLYKMAIWDVSQNVDRFKADLGIVSCITPGGSNFVTNRHTALTGSELLLLQGMPASKLLFAKETQKDLQDLAGNAMTTTVIGASLVAALITGWKTLKDTPHQSHQSTADLRNEKTTELVTVKSWERLELPPTGPDELRLRDLMNEGWSSSRLCNCEGTKKMSKSPIQICDSCGHTACSACAGNPKHAYSTKIAPFERKLGPSSFERKWRSLLPPRLKFSAFPNAQSLKKGSRSGHISNGEEWHAFINRIEQVNIPSIYFSIRGFKRCNASWRVMYGSREATLELVIADKLHWHLTVKCPSSEPGNSPLRKILAQPFARGLVDLNSTLLKPEWHIYTPRSRACSINITATGSASSWRSRIGLPDYKDETVPFHLQIDGGASREGEVLTGHYKHLPNCGTAKSSLYKAEYQDRDSMFLFLDQDPIGPYDQDSFVFSGNCERLPYGEARFLLGCIEPSWEPQSGSLAQVQVIVPGKCVEWVVKHVNLEAPSYTRLASVPSATALSSARIGRCSQALVLLDVETNVTLGVERFDQFAWTLEGAKTYHAFSAWQEFHATCPKAECDCAPVVPRILWSVNEKGEAIAQEDRKAAAVFERTLKTRCDIFHVKASKSPTGTRVRIAINLASLVHRARSRLLTPQSSSWRLRTDHSDLSPGKFPKFRLRSNASDEPYTGPLSLQYTLDRVQMQSLSWMRSQESGRRLSLMEVEEAIHSELGWRIEAQAKSSIVVRGGVLADLPSFGKTVTTIALINSEFEDATADTLLEQNRQFSAVSHLIDVAATLVVCPPHIAKQWQVQFRDCLGRDNSYNIILVESFSDLGRISIQDIRDARIVVLSWSVLADEAYISQLARFSAMPLPASTKGRAYDAWLDCCSDKIPSQVEAYERLGPEFAEHTNKLAEDRLAHSDFKATVPLKISHGSAYHSFNAMQLAKFQSAKPLKRTKRKGLAPRASGASHLSVPLLQMFRFNRIVIDEYHYLYGKNSEDHPACAVIKRISAPKRWVLSGTPALANFSDVNQIALFLGIKLGRDVYGDGTVTTALEKKLISEQTDAERFLSHTENMSYQWHEARHKRAQEFLDHFVRQNEPSLENITCQETLHPIELGIAHHAVYLELSQHLISQRMQIKKLNSKSKSYRSDRLNESLNNSATAEEALLKCALLFKTGKGESSLDCFRDIRRRERREIKERIRSLLKDLRVGCLRKLSDPTEDHYLAFKRDIQSGNIFGDEVVRLSVGELVRKVDEEVSIPRTKKKDTAPKDRTALKQLASELRATAHEFSVAVRSVRFVKSINSLLPVITAGNDGSSHACNSSSCTRTATLDQLYLISHCGHIVCAPCLQARTDSEACPRQGCEIPIQTKNLIKVSALGSRKDDVSRKSFGRKLDSISALIKRLPKNDQGIVFIPNDGVSKDIEDAFNHHKILFHSLSTRKAGAAKILEDFKTNTDPQKRKKVLILNLASETAAGANLVNANHIIFVSPLLAKSQSGYESAMAQAIARSRRYRQEKNVYIYHFAALRTIDVDILEHRHKHLDAIYGPGSALRMPLKCERKERTKMVRNRKGVVALVPYSWLANEESRKDIDVDEELESFTSLLTFSETFKTDGDDDDDDDD